MPFYGRRVHAKKTYSMTSPWSGKGTRRKADGSANKARKSALLVAWPERILPESGQQRRRITSRQGHITDGVQDFVAHEFVGGKRCRPGLTRPFSSSARVFSREAPSGKVHGVEAFQFFHKTECAGGGDDFREGGRGEIQRQGLAANGRGRQIRFRIHKPWMWAVATGLQVASFWLMLTGLTTAIASRRTFWLLSPACRMRLR